MSRLEVPVEGVGYEALAAFLESERSPPESLLMSDLDGFLTGIAIGPELIMPSEWLPVVWGGEQPAFGDKAEAQAIFAAIMSRYNEILREVKEGTFEPILWTDSDGTVIATDWGEGFALAMGLRRKAWESLLDAEEHAFLLFPILALCGDEDGQSALGLDTETEDAIMESAPKLLPEAVMEIAAFWRDRRAGGSGNLRTDRTTGAARVVPKAGRNDPCPCGSGKKFKKCCGT